MHEYKGWQRFPLYCQLVKKFEYSMLCTMVELGSSMTILQIETTTLIEVFCKNGLSSQMMRYFRIMFVLKNMLTFFLICICLYLDMVVK